MCTCYSSSDEDEARGFQTHTIDKGVHAMNEMAPFPHAPVRWRLHGWQTILLFGILEMAFRPAIGWAARSFAGPHASGSSWYASFVEGIYLGCKYFKGTMPSGPLSDDELRRITSPTLVLIGEQEHLYHPRAAGARSPPHPWSGACGDAC
jgi:hypothetical protein